MTPMDDVDEQLEVDAETAANLIAILGIKKPAIFDRLSLGRKTPREIAAIASYTNSPEHAVAFTHSPRRSSRGGTGTPETYAGGAISMHPLRT